MKIKKNVIILLFILLAVPLKAVDWNKYNWVASQITPSMFMEGYYLELHFLPDNPQYGFACGHFVSEKNYGDGIFAKTIDGGKTWQASNLGVGLHCESVHFVDTLVGYISGTNFLLKTVDGGDSWEKINIPYVNEYEILLGYIWGNWVIGDTIWVMLGGCSVNSQYVLRSLDGGDSWTSTRLTTDADDHFTDITIMNDGTGYIIGSLYIWTTNDFGETWWKLNKTAFMNAYGTGIVNSNWHEDIAFKDSLFCIPYSMSCGGSELGPGAFAYSSDYGRTWKSLLYTKTPNYGTAMLNDGTAFGCGVDGNLYMTTDKGSTWISYNCGVENYDLDDIYFVNDTTGYVCGGGGIFYLGVKDFKLTVDGEFQKCNDVLTTISINEKYNNYEWYQIVDGDTIEISNNSSNQLDTGTYFVIGYDSKCVYANSNEFKISNYEKQNFNIYSDKPEYCEGEISKIWIDTNELKQKNINIYDLKWYSVNANNDTTLIATNTTEIEILTYIDLNIIFTYNDIGNCGGVISYSVPVYPVIEPVLNVIGSTQLCIEQSATIVLLNAEQYKDIKWYKDNQMIAQNTPELSVDKSGNYFVTCYVNSLCPSNSDTIKITEINLKDVLTFEVDSMFVDSLNYGKTATAELKITNISDTSITLTNIYLKYKFAFTIQVSSLPLTISPHSSEIIHVFYTPTNLNWQYDTMVIADFCTDHEIPLSAFAEGNFDSTRSDCDVLIYISTRNIDIPAIINLSQPKPNPSTSLININYKISSTNNDGKIDDNIDINAIDFDVSIYDVLGNKLNNNFVIDNLTMYNSGTITTDISDLTDGIYFIKIKINDNYKIFSIIKLTN